MLLVKWRSNGEAGLSLILEMKNIKAFKQEGKLEELVHELSRYQWSFPLKDAMEWPLKGSNRGRAMLRNDIHNVQGKWKARVGNEGQKD